jgi:hypothetical protein
MMTSRDFCQWLGGYLDALPDPENAGLEAYAVKRLREKLGTILANEPAPPFPWTLINNSEPTLYRTR